MLPGLKSRDKSKHHHKMSLMSRLAVSTTQTLFCCYQCCNKNLDDEADGLYQALDSSRQESSSTGPCKT